MKGTSPEVTRIVSKYGKGIHITKAGHLRYGGPKILRGKYVHRELVERLISETPYSIQLMLPWPYEVHHMDYNKKHNCGPNLLILPEEFHSKITADGRQRTNRGRFQPKFHPKWKPAPEWVLFPDPDEIPF